MPQCRLLPVGTFPIWAWFTLSPMFWKLALWLRTSCYCLMSFKEYWYLSQVMPWPRHLAWTHQKCTNATILRRKEVIDSSQLRRVFKSQMRRARKKRNHGSPPQKENIFPLHSSEYKFEGRDWVIACPTYVPNNRKLWNKSEFAYIYFKTLIWSWR